VGEFALDRRANDDRAFQFTAWEVEKTTMDVHTGEIRYRSDPSATAVVPASAGAGQGQLFDDPGGRSFADTDQLPAVGRGRRASNPYGAPRWLRVTIVAVVIGILAAGGTLALVKTGVIGKTTSPPARAHTNTTTPPTNVVHTKTLLTPAQTFGGALCLLAIESELRRYEPGNGFPVAGNYYLCTTLDLVEESAKFVFCFKGSDFTHTLLQLADHRA